MPDFNSRVRDALVKLDGTKAAAVSLLTGMSRKEIDGLGGIDEEPVTRQYVAFRTEAHDATHSVIGARDSAGAFMICVTCVHLRIDGQAS